MGEITVMYQPPVIFTKDEAWLSNAGKRIRLEPGALVLLPEDAVLYEPPTNRDKEV